MFKSKPMTMCSSDDIHYLNSDFGPIEKHCHDIRASCRQCSIFIMHKFPTFKSSYSGTCSQRKHGRIRFQQKINIIQYNYIFIHYYSLLHLSKIGKYRKWSILSVSPSVNPSICLCILKHSSMMAG